MTNSHPSKQAIDFLSKRTAGLAARFEFGVDVVNDSEGVPYAVVWMYDLTNGVNQVSSKSLNEELLENGLGKMSPTATRLPWGQLLRDAEDRAKARRLGIWKIQHQ
jgi:endonuclease YncB( thermonuclease family)